MDAERWRRIGELFEAALAIPDDRRIAWLESQTADDPDAGHAVRQLLDADQRPSGGLVDRLDAGALWPIDPLIDRTLGPWRVVAVLGAGGMGTVYRARRADGAFDRDVAIKVLRADLASVSSGRSFSFERRTLAALRHPGIAQLMDGGTTPDGRPYLVMELVDGTQITEHCEQHGSSVADKLRLGIQVCRAVQFAHSRLVVHRDIKPSNVLVDAHGAPKLIDFGIARMLDEGDATDQPTIVARLTPRYASPGQLLGEPATTADDVYSLGVLLYELLTGEPPYRIAGIDVREWQRIVTETAPLRPSAVVVDRPPLARRLRGDLDRILLMALRRDPSRRYASAGALADDIERHLRGLPVEARADSIAYRVGRFAVRHRIGLGAAAAVVIALSLGLSAAVRGERRAHEQALHAQAEAESAQEIADYVIAEMLVDVDPDDPNAIDSYRSRIDQRAESMRRQYANRGHIRANLLDSLGQVADRLGLATTAQELLEEAESIRAREFGIASVERSRSLANLGRYHYGRGEFERAAELLAEGLSIQRANPTGPHSDVARFANDLAACRRATGDLAGAAMLLEEAIELRSRDGALLPAVAESLNNLANVRLQQAKFDAAAELLARSHAIREHVLGATHVLTVQSLANRAVVESKRGEPKLAEDLLRRAADGYRALGAAGLDGLAQVLHNRGYLAQREGRLDEAAQLFAEADDLLVRLVPPHHPRAIDTLRERIANAKARGATEELVELNRRLQAASEPR